MSTWSLTCRQNVFVTAEQQTFLRVLPRGWQRNPAGIDMERNYVTVTLCVHGVIDLILFYTYAS